MVEYFFYTNYFLGSLIFPIQTANINLLEIVHVCTCLEHAIKPVFRGIFNLSIDREKWIIGLTHSPHLFKIQTWQKWIPPNRNFNSYWLHVGGIFKMMHISRLIYLLWDSIPMMGINKLLEWSQLTQVGLPVCPYG